MSLNKGYGYRSSWTRPGAAPSARTAASRLRASRSRPTRASPDKDGQRQERTEWFHIVVFGKLGETCKEYLKKGRQVYVEGRLRTREYEARNNGGKRQRTEIVASRVQFLGTPPAEAHAAAEVGGGEPASEEIPF